MSRKEELKPSEAYIHDDFEPLAMSKLEKQKLSATRVERKATVMPQHLLFDISKTQIASQIARSQPRARLPRRDPAGNTSLGKKGPKASKFMPSASAPSTAKLSPMTTKQKLRRLTNPELRRSATADPAASASLLGEAAARPATAAAELIPRPATAAEFAELQRLDDNTQRRKRAMAAKGSSFRPTMRTDLSVDELGGPDGSMVAQEATKMYVTECFQPDGTYIPARHRVLPHVMVENSHPRAYSTLAVIRKHDFITKSPAHTRATTISQRGYVEVHRKGLTEFSSMEDLSNDLCSFTLMKRLAIIRQFREYKVFRNWELMLRQRKFRQKVARLEGLMLRSHRDLWACVESVQASCVALVQDMKDKDFRPPSTGFTVEAFSKELHRRKDILQESLDVTRQAISEQLDRYFASVSQEAQLGRLRTVFKHNRDNDPDAADAKASEDMVLLCRLFVMAEHILNQTAIEMHNEELGRVCRMFDVDMLGSIQADCFMHLDEGAEVSMDLPYSQEQLDQFSECVHLTLVPDGNTLLEVIGKELSQIYHSLAYTLRPRVVPKIDQYIAPDVLARYIVKKPDYLFCVTNSRKFLAGHAHLDRVVSMSEVSALKHMRGFNVFRPIFAYIQTHAATESMVLGLDGKTFDNFHERAEQYTQWHMALSKVSVSEQEIGAFRVKGRRMKLYMQERLQGIIDSQFESFYHYVMKYITDLKLIGSRYAKKLDTPITSFSTLAEILPFVLDLKPKIDEYEEGMIKAVKMRETLQHHYALTTRATTTDAKISLPAFNAQHCEQLRNQHNVALKRMSNQKEHHKELITNAAEVFFKQVKNFNGALHSQKVNNIKDDPAKICKYLDDGVKHLAELRKKAVGFKAVLDRLGMPPLNLGGVETAEHALTGLQDVWACVADFMHFKQYVMKTPLLDLRTTDTLQEQMDELLQTIRELLERYSDLQILRDLKFEFEELHYMWPSVEKLTDKKMKKAHYDELLHVEGSIAFVDLAKLTVSDCIARGALRATSKLVGIHALAVREDETFGMLERLKGAMKEMSVRVCREGLSVWLEGLELQVSQVQDHALVAAWVQQSPFKDLAARDMQEITQANSEAAFITGKLAFSHEAWRRARVLLRRRDLLERPVVQALEMAESKWLSCIAALCEGGDNIRVSRFDFQDNLRVRETVEHWERAEHHFPGVAARLRAEFPPLLFLSDGDALLLCSYFQGPGPRIDTHIVAECFSNVHAVAFNRDSGRPEGVCGAHCEELSVAVDDKYANTNPTSRMCGLLAALPSAVLSEFKQCVSTVPGDGTAEDFVAWGRGFVAQCVSLALQVSWTEFYLECLKEAPRSASTDAASHVDAYAGVLGEGLQLGGGAASALDRAKTSAALMHAVNWREALLADNGWGWRDVEPEHQARRGSSERPPTTTTAAGAQVVRVPRPLGLVVYCLADDGTLRVEAGPHAYAYGFEFLDGTQAAVHTPQTARCVLGALASFAAGTCGVLAAAAGGGSTEMARDAGRACGRAVRVVDCLHGADAARLACVVEGTRKTGGWLAVKGHGCLDREGLSALAKGMLEVMAIYRRKAAEGKLFGPHERPAMFLIGDSAVLERGGDALPAELREATRPCVIADVDKRAVCEALLCAEGFEGWGPAGARLEAAMGMLGIGVTGQEAWICGVRAARAVVKEAARLKRLRVSLRVKIEQEVADAYEGEASILIEGLEDEDQEGTGNLFDTPAADDAEVDTDASRLRDDSQQQDASVRGSGLFELNYDGKTETDEGPESEVSTRSSNDDRFDYLDDSTDSWVAAAFLRIARSSLSEPSYRCSLMACRFAWGEVIPHIEELQPGPDKDLERKVAAVLFSKKMTHTREFLARCTAVSRGLLASSHPKLLILAGPPRSGKSTCIDIVKRARMIDLDDPFRDPLPEAAVKTVTPMAFFAVEGPEGEVYDRSSIQLLREYTDWFTGSEVRDSFMYPERWLVLDCTEVRQMDAWLAHRYDRINIFLDSGTKLPSIIIETCSLEHAVPGLVSSSILVPFGTRCLGWEVMFSAWRLGPGALLETRTIKELERLAKVHIPHVEAFVSRSCRRIAFQPLASIAQTFISILHYYFFLGSDKPSRRTISFTRCAFVFAITWSWGVLLTNDDRRQFDHWFQDRMRKAGISNFDGKNSGQWHSLWDYYLSLEVMDLVLFSSTHEAFVKETHAHTQGLGSVLVPTQEMRAAHLLLNVHRTKGTHTLIIGQPGAGKTLFLDWRRFRSKIPDQKHPTNLALTSATTSKSLADFLAKASDAVPEEQQADFYHKKGMKVLVLIDDVHVALQAEGVLHKGMGPVAELLRHVLNAKGLVKPRSVQEDQSLDNITMSLSCEESFLLTRTANTHTPVHTHARLLAQVAPILLGPVSHASLSSIISHTPLAGPKFQGALRGVLDRLPLCFVGVHEWVVKNLAPASGDEGLIFWDLEHVKLLVGAVHWLPFAKMRAPDEFIRFCWHEMMRTYSDRVMRFDQVESLRTNLRNVFTRLIGIIHIRRVRQASESRKFFALLPTQAAQASPTAQTPSRRMGSAWKQLKSISDSRKAWEVVELSPDELVKRARMSFAQEYGLSSVSAHDVTSIANFPRHLAHALHALRPSSRAHGCVLVGPPGSGRKGVVRCAAAMCGFRFVQLDGMGIAKAMDSVDGAVQARMHVVFLLSADGGLLQDVHFGGLVNRLCRVQGLTDDEQNGVRGVRFAVCVGVDALAPEEGGANLPVHLRGLLRFFTVDWYEGWSDEALARSIDFAGKNTLNAMGMLALPPPSADDPDFEDDEAVETSILEDQDDSRRAGSRKLLAARPPPLSTLSLQDMYTHNPQGILWRAAHAESLFRVHRCIEEAAPDMLDGFSSGGSDSFPTPLLAAKFAKMFAEAFALREKYSGQRLKRLETACEMYDSVEAHVEWLEQQHKLLVPKVQQSQQTQLKWRDDTLHFGSVASRARRMAEDDVIDGVVQVLYGDAPGADIQKEHKESVRHYQSACEAVTNLKEVHFIQLEMCDSHVELLKLLWESLCVCLGEEVSDEGIKRLRVESCRLPEMVSKADINHVELQTKNALRLYTSNPMFIPEKMFSVNRAAGTLCGWARCFERCARAIEWLRPDSQSNTKQSLDRVRATSKAQLFALKQIEQGVETAKERHIQAIEDEKTTKAEMAHLQKQIRECRRIVNGCAHEYVAWKAEIGGLRTLKSTEAGDTVLACAYTSYLGALPYEKRKKLVKSLKVAAEGEKEVDGDPIKCSEHFILETYCEADKALRNWEAVGLSQDGCTRENAVCVCIAAKSGFVPLLIDPWMNGTMWLRRLHEEQLVVFSAGPPFKTKRSKSASDSQSTSVVESPAAAKTSPSVKSPSVKSISSTSVVASPTTAQTSPSVRSPSVKSMSASAKISVYATGNASDQDLDPEAAPFADSEPVLNDLNAALSAEFSGDTKELEATLRRAFKSDLPVLIEDAEFTLPLLMHVLDVVPELVPPSSSELLVGEDAFEKQAGKGYKIYMSTHARKFFPPLSALERVAVINWEGDEDAMEDVALDAVLSCVDPSAWDMRETYIGNSVRLKQSVRKIQKSAFEALYSYPVLDELKLGDGQVYVDLCNDLDAAKKTDQDHTIHSSEGLKRVEAYRGLALAMARLLCAAERVGGMAGSLVFSIYDMVGTLQRAAKGLDMHDIQYGTMGFKTALEGVSGRVVRECLCVLRGGLPDVFADVARLWVGACVRDGYVLHELLERMAVSMDNKRLGEGPGGVLTPAGWRGLQGCKDVLGVLYGQLMLHVERFEWDWFMWASRVVPEQGFDLPFLPESGHMDIKSRLLITACMQPAKLPAALHQLAVDIDEGDVSLCDKISAVAAAHDPGEPVCLVTSVNSCAVNKMMSIALHKHSIRVKDGKDAVGGMTADMFRVIHSMGAPEGADPDEASIKVLEKAVNSGSWVCVITPSWRDRLMWLRRARSLLLSRRANKRFRIFWQVPLEDVERNCGAMASCTVTHCSNPCEVNALFIACVADCFHRGVGTADSVWQEKGARFFWRAVMGVCYMHAVIAKEQANVDSVAFPGVKRVSLPQLVQCVRFISSCDMVGGGWRGALAAARAVVQGACYADVFARCSCGYALFHAALSRGLYASRSQVEIFGLMLQSPDVHVPKNSKDAYAWAGLHSYAVNLNAALPSAFHPPSVIELDNAHATGFELATSLRTGLPKQMHAADEDQHVHAVSRRAVSLARALYAKLPASLRTRLGIMSLYGLEGDEALRTHVISTQTEIDRLFGAVLMREAEGANGALQRAGEDLSLLNAALDGTRFFCGQARAIYMSIVKDRVPLGWDAEAHERKQSLRSWLEQLRERMNYLINRLQDDKLGNSRRMKAQAMLVPLKSMAEPQRILRAYVAALCLSKPGLNPHEVCFCAFQIPIKEDRRQPPPEQGLYLNGLIFRCGVWNAKLGLLEDPEVGDVSFSHTASVWLRPLPMSELPGRQRMKVMRQHWSELPLYSTPPSSTDMYDLGDPLCTIFVRTPYRGVTVHQRGVYALLRDTV